MYVHGDVVKLKSFDKESEYHIITDFEEYINPITKKDGYRYELMKIFPVERMSKVEYVNHMEVKLIGRASDIQGKAVLELVKKEREKKGFLDKPEYIKAIEVNIHSDKSTLNRYVDESIARYDLIKTVDGCLDAINDLNQFYEVFGDEAYLQLKEVVYKRLKSLT